MAVGPSLADHAEVITTADGLLIQVADELIRVESPLLEGRAERLIESLDGSRELQAIAEEVELPLDDVEAIVELLADEGLLAEGPATEPALARGGVRDTSSNDLAQLGSLLFVGRGDLALAIIRALISRGAPEPRVLDYERLSEAVAGAAAVVCCLDRPSHLGRVVLDACVDVGTPALVVEVDRDRATIGPWVRGRSLDHGCSVCAVRHRGGRDLFEAALPGYLERRFPAPARWRRPPYDLAALAGLVADHVAAGPDRLGQRLVVDLDGDAPTLEQLVPKHPACPVCQPGSGASDPFSSPATEELVPLTEIARRLRPLVDPELGWFSSSIDVAEANRGAIDGFCSSRGVSPEASLVAHIHSFVARAPTSHAPHLLVDTTEGSAFDDPEVAEALALVEGVERLFTMRQFDSSRVVAKAFDGVADHALDPRSFPLYGDHQYNEDNFPVARFDPHVTIPWTKAIRLRDREPVLVPMGLFTHTFDSPIYLVNSNGSACHSSFWHAVVNGIYETIERDALMVVWLNRLSMPRIELDRDELSNELDRLGFELAAFDATTDLGIPVVMGVLRDRHNPDFFMLDAVSAATPAATAAKLRRELLQFSMHYVIDPSRYQGKVSGSTDPSVVRDFPHHVEFYQSATNIEHTQFLTASKSTRPVAGLPWPTADGINAELTWLVDRLAEHGYEVLVVDCTHPILEPLGLHVVKVLIPGLQPLHAGYRFRALGGRRLFEVAQLRGVSSRASRCLARARPP